VANRSLTNRRVLLNIYQREQWVMKWQMGAEDGPACPISELVVQVSLCYAIETIN